MFSKKKKPAKRQLTKLLYISRNTRSHKRTRPKRKQKSAHMRHISTSFNKSISKFITPQLLLLCVTVVCAGVALGILFFSNFFHISDVLVVRDSVYIDPQKVEEAMKPILGENILFLSTDRYEVDLKVLFPAIERIEISKILPRSVQLRLVSYPFIATIKNEGAKSMYLLSQNGAVIPNEAHTGDGDEVKNDLLNVEIPAYRTLPEESRNMITELIQLQPNTIFFAEDDVRALQYTAELYKRNFQAELKKIYWLPLEHEMHLELASGSKIYIWLDKNVDTQLFKLKTAEPTLDLGSGAVAYVDLRIKDRIDICLKGKQCAR